MNLLSISKLSVLIGISRQAVSKALKDGKISFTDTEKKLIDIDLPEIQNYINSRNKKLSNSQKIKHKEVKKKEAVSRGEKLTNKQPPQPKEQPAPKKQIPSQKQIIKNPDLVEQFSDESLNFMTKDELDCIHKAERIRIDRVKGKKDRGDLIDREFVKMLFDKIYSIDVNEFLQLSASLSAKICDIFGIEDPEKLMELSETIDKELYKTQEHVKYEIDKFLNDMEKVRV